jgi:hypothetical protein
MRISCDPHIATLHESSTTLDGYYCSREKVLLTPPLSPAEWLAGPTSVYLLTQPLKQ